MKQFKILIAVFVLIFSPFCLISLEGCGFQPRGQFACCSALQKIKICSNEPYEPFQRVLRLAFKNNGMEVASFCDTDPRLITLVLVNHEFKERTIAYGSDTEANRSIIEFIVKYHLENAKGCLFPESTVQVQRELTLTPTAVLSTENERAQLRSDLYLDAATQLMRQLSVYTDANICK